jgi:hypothetical protein
MNRCHFTSFVADLCDKFRSPGCNLVVKCLRDEGEERPLVLRKALRGRWGTHQIGDCLGKTTDKVDFKAKILLVDSTPSGGGGGKSSLSDNSGARPSLSSLSDNYGVCSSFLSLSNNSGGAVG